ncbi:hypothetical protein HK104_010175 [Borealophlyctis nickersoniae]|nr:hypothetical protein HK104_010175 [Borealophlyctis nickersoniae]
MANTKPDGGASVNGGEEDEVTAKPADFSTAEVPMMSPHEGSECASSTGGDAQADSSGDEAMETEEEYDSDDSVVRMRNEEKQWEKDAKRLDPGLVHYAMTHLSELIRRLNHVDTTQVLTTFTMILSRFLIEEQELDAIPDPEFTFLCGKLIPKTVKQILSWRVIAFGIRFIEMDIRPLRQAMKWILCDYEKKLYHFRDLDKFDDDETMEDEYPDFFIQSVKCFLDLGGLTEVQRIAASPNSSVASLSDILAEVAMVFVVHPGPKKQNFHYICEALYKKAKDWPEEDFKSMDKGTLAQLVDSLDNIALRLECYPNALHSLRLIIVEKCIRSPSMDKRLLAVNQLLSSLEDTKVAPTKERRRNWSKWMRDHEILEQLFGPNVHVGIINKKEILEVLKDLLEHDEFRPEDLDIVWTPVTTNQHQTVIHQVYSIIETLSSSFSPDLLDNVISKMQSLPMSCVDARATKLIHTVAISAHRMQAYLVCCQGIRKLWEILQDYDGPDLEVRNAACQWFTDVPRWVPLIDIEDFREEMLSAALKNLEEHVSVPNALFLAYTVICSYMSKHPESSFRAEVFQGKKLRSLFFEDLKAFQAKMRPKLVNPPASNENVDEEQLSSDFAAYDHEIETRFQFMEYFKGPDALFPSSDQFDIVWDECVLQPLSTVARDRAYLAMEIALRDELLFTYITEGHVLRINPFNVSAIGWRFLKLWFMRVNVREGRMEFIGDMEVDGEATNQPAENYCIVGPLLSKDYIRKVAVGAIDEVVANDAMNFYVDLHLKARILTRGKVYIYQALTVILQVPAEAARAHEENLIDACLQELKSAATAMALQTSANGVAKESPTQSSDVWLEELRFRRSLQLLKTHMTKTKSSVTSNNKPPMVLPVQVRQDSATFSVDADLHRPVGDLRQLIAETLKESDASNLRLLVSGQELIDDNVPLIEKRAMLNMPILVVKRPGPAKPISRAPYQLTRFDVLLQPRYFDILFSMLGLEEQYAVQISEFLKGLPMDPRLLSKFSQLDSDGPVNWEELFVGSSPLRLLYSLEAVQMAVPNDLKDPRETKWKRGFRTSGGTRRLLDIITGGGYLSSIGSRATKDVFAQLLYVIGRTCVDPIELGEDVIQPLVRALMSVIRRCSETPFEASPVAVAVEGQMISNAILFLEQCIRERPTLVPVLYEIFEGEGWVLALLIETSKAEISAKTSAFILHCCSLSSPLLKPSPGHQHPFVFMFDVLLSLLPAAEERPTQCRVFFDLLAILTGTLNAQSMKQYPFTQRDMRAFARDIAARIEAHSALGRGTLDTVIYGLLKLECAVLKNFPELKEDPEIGQKLLEMVFQDCLFALPPLESDGSPLPPKCKNEFTREPAFELLYSLAVPSSPQFSKLAQWLSEQIMSVAKTTWSHWNYSPGSVQRDACGYAGLRNLGATCYVNSIMQQFYMIPSFRSAILSADTGDSEDKKDNLLYQLQVLFSNLQETQKRDYAAVDFCHSFKDYDGKPMNVFVQTDVDEFFNQLFDRLERLLRGKPEEVLFKNHFGGQLLQEVVPKGCNHISPKEDNFFAIQCEVKNKKNLKESLEMYIEGEMMDGDNQYSCNGCGKLVDATKRAVIKTLPNTLIIHLKRFDFDVEAMMRKKLNDRFEFPHRLNMEPYTHDYIKKKEGQTENANGPESPSAGIWYELVGVLVHAGHADSGHYYSYIKDRKTSAWFRFDDSSVTPFDLSQRDRHWYGGEEYSGPDARKCHRTYNAYMLFYERVGANNCNVVCKVPDGIRKSIWRENCEFLMETNVFEPAYRNFLFHLVKNGFEAAGKDNNEAAVTSVIQLATTYFLNILCRSFDRASIEDWKAFLAHVYSRHTKSCTWFLTEVTRPWEDDDGPVILEQLLLSCTVPEVREAFVDLVATAAQSLRQNDPTTYGLTLLKPQPIGDATKASVGSAQANAVDRMPDDAKMEGVEGPASTPPEPAETYTMKRDGVLPNLLGSLLSLWEDVPSRWRTFDQYFALFRRIAELGFAETEFMISRGMVHCLAGLLLGPFSPLKRDQESAKTMGDSFTSADFNPLAATLRILLLSATFPDVAGSLPAANGSEEDGENRLARLLTKDVQVLTHKFQWTDCEGMVIIFRMLWLRIDIAVASDIVIHMCTGRLGISKEVVLTLVSELGRFSVRNAGDAMELFCLVLKIGDAVAKMRVHHGIVQLLKFIHQNSLVERSFVLDVFRFFGNRIMDPNDNVCRHWVRENQALLLKYRKCFDDQELLTMFEEMNQAACAVPVPPSVQEEEDEVALDADSEPGTPANGVVEKVEKSEVDMDQAPSIPTEERSEMDTDPTSSTPREDGVVEKVEKSEVDMDQTPSMPTEEKSEMDTDPTSSTPMEEKSEVDMDQTASTPKEEEVPKPTPIDGLAEGEK